MIFIQSSKISPQIQIQTFVGVNRFLGYFCFKFLLKLIIYFNILLINISVKIGEAYIIHPNIIVKIIIVIR